MVKIRLRRTGQRGRPHYRIVVADARRSRDGKYIEALGHYNPRDKALVLNKERADYWLAQGAQPTDTAGRLIRRYAQMVAKPAATPAEPAAETASVEPVTETTPAADAGIEATTSQGGDNEATG